MGETPRNLYELDYVTPRIGCKSPSIYRGLGVIELRFYRIVGPSCYPLNRGENIQTCRAKYLV